MMTRSVRGGYRQAVAKKSFVLPILRDDTQIGDPSIHQAVTSASSMPIKLIHDAFRNARVLGTDRQAARVAMGWTSSQTLLWRNGMINTTLKAAVATLVGFTMLGGVAVAGPKSKSEKDRFEIQILSFNDYHGHLKTDAVGFRETRGGGEYLAAKLKELRSGKKYSITVAAGDLIGGTPAFSGLFRDEPSVESLNVMGLDLSGVGNHEFDEGVTELLRMQNGGCHPDDGCFFPETPYAGADFSWLAANVISEVDGESTPLPAYEIRKFRGVKVAFIGMTLEATDTLVAAAGIRGWDFTDEVETANNLVPILKGQGVEAIVVLLHEGGSQDPAPGDVNACNAFSGPITAINAGLDPEIDLLITGHTHLPYNCVLPDSAGQPRIVTSAYSYGRVVTELNLSLIHI